MRRTRSVLIATALVTAAACSKPADQPAASAAAPAGPARGTNEWKIDNAMSGGPAEVARGAAVMDYPSSDTGHMTQLKAGTNGWTCLPDMPNTPANDPGCYDAQWVEFFAGWMQHRAPNITAVGYAYMLQGSADASLTDPFKMAPDSGQSWHLEGPHVMLVFPRAQSTTLNALPDHPSNGGPYVMFKGTPYAHVMWPTAHGT